jgi:hypothetical protein
VWIVEWWFGTVDQWFTVTTMLGVGILICVLGVQVVHRLFRGRRDPGQSADR